ncbi:hypothetical protein ACQKP8_16690 [Photobacterium alginatilyticum]|uniref:hypothetical protein n=1 Tax=Photobacterium alginatilyticum TaxID=1775171 RepID=UPI004068D990
MFELDDEQIKFVSGASAGEEDGSSGHGSSSGEEHKPKPPCYCHQPSQEPCPTHWPPQKGEEGYYR